jgi:hypothetical protein
MENQEDQKKSAPFLSGRGDAMQQKSLQNASPGSILETMKTSSRSPRFLGLDAQLGRLELRVLDAHLGGQSAVADLLRVNRSSVSRWLSGRPEPSQMVRIAGLGLVVRKLLSVLSRDAALQWLKGVNAHLANQKPVDLLRGGRLSEVLAAVEQEDTLAYA